MFHKRNERLTRIRAEAGGKPAPNPVPLSCRVTDTELFKQMGINVHRNRKQA
jgi:hypothetical protein